MKLSDLEPRFLRLVTEQRFERVDRIEEADGVMFLCPECWKKNGGEVGTHRVLCWQPHVPLAVPPGPGRWKFEGSGYDDLTLVAGSSSIHLQGGCEAHFFVRDGLIQ